MDRESSQQLKEELKEAAMIGICLEGIRTTTTNLGHQQQVFVLGFETEFPCI